MTVFCNIRPDRADDDRDMDEDGPAQEWEELLERLDNWNHNLTEVQRQAFARYFFETWSFGEIADETKQTEDDIRCLLVQAVQLLYRYL